MEIISFLNSGAFDVPAYDPLPLDIMLERQRKLHPSGRRTGSVTARTYAGTASETTSHLAESAKAFAAAIHGLRWYFLVMTVVILASAVSFWVYGAYESRPLPAVFVSIEETGYDAVEEAISLLVLGGTEEEISEDGFINEVIVSANYSRTVEYSTYTVRSGDTITDISKKFGLANISTIISVNNIENARKIWVGQKLKIPSMDGIKHTVVSGDTLGTISARYGISIEDILDVNDMASDVLYPGMNLFIPGGRLDSETLKKALGESWIFPLTVKYVVSSEFGTRPDPFTGVTSNHTGTDFAVSAGTPIRACQSGTVAVAGWSNTYGNYVIISHGNGYQTLYAHMQKYTVKKGDVVSQGQNIGYVGSTGYSTGPHLHLTVYKNSQLVDPATILKF